MLELYLSFYDKLCFYFVIQIFAFNLFKKIISEIASLGLSRFCSVTRNETEFLSLAGESYSCHDLIKNSFRTRAIGSFYYCEIQARTPSWLGSNKQTRFEYT